MNGFATTRLQMAHGYGISPQTFRKWLKTEKIALDSGLISPKKQLEIRNKLGDPKNFNANLYIENQMKK